MTDYQRELSIGEQQVVRRGFEPPDGWRNRTAISLAEGQSALLTGGSMPTKRRPRGSGGPTIPTPPPPDPPPNPEPDTGTVQGYARVWMLANGKSGGSISVDDIHTPAADATVYTVSTYAQLKAARLASGKRFIKVVGGALLDGAGAEYTVTHGDLTEDGSFYTGRGTKDDKVVWRCSNVILTQMAYRPGEGSTAGKSADRRATSFNPGNDGSVIHGIVLDHNSESWGPDVIGSLLNNTEDVTIQYCMIGPGLETSNNVAENPNGYGFNLTTPGNSDPSTIYTKRVTFYRNLMCLCKQRNMKAEHTLGVDYVNNVVYDWGNQCPVHGNARGENIVNNIFKKGPQTQASNAAFEADPNYAQYAASTYHSGDIGITAAGGSFTPTWTAISGGALRGTPYDGGPTDADHGALTVDTADATLFADVVANAGRTFEDATDALMRDYATNGTDGGDFYQGVGFGSPNPSWA